MKAVALRSGSDRAPAFAAALFLASCTAVPSPNASALSLETVPNRADLISGGDVLVRLNLPANADASRAVFSLNGQPFREPGAGSPASCISRPTPGAGSPWSTASPTARNTLTLA